MRKNKKKMRIPPLILKEEIKYAIDSMCEDHERFTPFAGLFFWIAALAYGIFYESIMMVILSVFCIILFIYILFFD